MNCNDTKLSLGVYLTGALDASERAQVDAHLRTCGICRAELDELSGLPGLLDRLSLEDLNPEPVPLPDDLFDRVARQVRAESAAADAPRRARGRRLLAAAAALVIVTGGSVGTWAALHGPKHYVSVNSAVRMDVTLASQATGTSYTVSVTGLPIDEHCRLIAVANDGTRDLAGEWDATYQGDAKETGSTSIPRDRLAKLVLLGTNGEQLSAVTV